MASLDKHLPEVIQSDIEKVQKILEEMHKKIIKRVVELKLMPGEVISQIRRVDGVLVEFEKKV